MICEICGIEEKIGESVLHAGKDYCACKRCSGIVGFILSSAERKVSEFINEMRLRE